MKPRFSILTLLAITGFLAIICASYVSSEWQVLAKILWWLMTLVLIVVAIGKTAELSMFARGFLLACVWLQVMVGTRTDEVPMQTAATVLGTLVGYSALAVYRCQASGIDSRVTRIAGRLATHVVPCFVGTSICLVILFLFVLITELL
jgi:hypothetical protein